MSLNQKQIDDLTEAIVQMVKKKIAYYWEREEMALRTDVRLLLSDVSTTEDNHFEKTEKKDLMGG